MQIIVQTPTPKLADSIAFYEQLQFTPYASDQPHWYTDGKIILEINPEASARAGLKCYQKDWSSAVQALADYSSIIKTEEGYLLVDPSGVWIYLIEREIPTFQLAESAYSVLGNYAGISMEVIDLGKAIQFWEVLGFRIAMGGPTQGWVSLTNDQGANISVMKAFACPHLFFNPSLSYFNGKQNLEIIARLHSLNVTITQEITCFNPEGIVDNVIIRDPGGLGFFIFSD